MSVSSRRSPSGRVAVVSLVGDHDIATSAALRAAFASARGAALVIADLSACTFLDSTAMAVLVRASKDAREDGTDLIGINPQPAVAKALKITGLDQLLRTTSDVALGEEAVDLLVREAPER